MTVSHTTPANGNVFADLGLDEPDRLLAKARLVAVMLRSIEEMGLTQVAAAKRMGIPQPRLSNMMRGRLDGISEAKIAECLRMLGHDVDYSVGKRRDGIGRTIVSEAA